MASEKLSLILGCGGYKYHSLVLCGSTCNIILDFDRHFEGGELEKIMDFLDFTCSLFDSPIGDWNKIANTLKMLRERYHLIDDKMWEALHVWLPLHKRCGAYLRLVINAELDVMFSQASEVNIIPNTLKS